MKIFLIVMNVVLFISCVLVTTLILSRIYVYDWQKINNKNMNLSGFAQLELRKYWFRCWTFVGTFWDVPSSYILKAGVAGVQTPQTIWNFRRKIVWERKNYQFCGDQEASGVEPSLFLDTPSHYFSLNKNTSCFVLTFHFWMMHF